MSRAEQAKAEGRAPTRDEVRADIYDAVIAAMALLQQTGEQTESYWPANVQLNRLLNQYESAGLIAAMEQLRAVALSLKDGG